MKGTTLPSKESQLKALVECGRQFYDRQWMMGTAGNLSVKLQQSPLEIAITPSGLNKGSLSTTDLLIIKDAPSGKGAPAANKKGPAPLVPSAETVIHQAIHKTLPGCGAVFHVHPMFSTLMSAFHGHPKQRQMLQVEWFEMMKGVGIGEGEIGEIPIFPNWQDVSMIARDVQQYLLETPKAPPVALIYNHGLTGWGRTPEQARNHLEIVEFVCKYLYFKRLANKN